MEFIGVPSRQQLHGICTLHAEAEVPELAPPLRPLYDLVLQRGVHMEEAAIGTADGLAALTAQNVAFHLDGWARHRGLA